ncbi:MAG: carbohydrate ABC transporter permease [Anaerolineales bacterium]
MTAQIRKPSNYKLRRGINTALVYAFLFAFFLYFIIPLVWLLLASTKTNAGLFSTFGLWFGKEFNLLKNLQDLFAYDGGKFALWIRNTAVYAASAALGSSIISTLAGYAFAKYRFSGRNVMFGLVVASTFIPATVFAVPLFLIMSKSGLSNTLWAVILPGLVNPFGVYLMRVYATEAIPDDLVDAARVDGANDFMIFFTIAMRLLAPGFVTVLLFAFVGAWNNYFLPLLLLTDRNVYLLTTGLAYWNSLAAQPGVNQVLYVLVITGSVVAVLPIMILFLFLQRYWQSGLTLGSVTG